MNTKNNLNIYLVDDDAVFLKSLEIDFTNAGNFVVTTFATGELCLAELDQQPDIIILDYHLDGIDPNAMNGLTTLDKIKSFNSEIPVIILSSQDKIEVAVKCIHHRAFDYVVKSETSFLRLKKIIDTINHFKKMEKELKWYMERM